MGLIQTILSPPFLVRNIDTISLLLGATLLVIFSDLLNKYLVFPIADRLKKETKGKLDGTGRRNVKNISTYVSATIATSVFIGYVYVEEFVLAEYVFAPIMRSMQDFLLLVIIALFILISHFINNIRVRKKFMGG